MNRHNLSTLEVDDLISLCGGDPGAIIMRTSIASATFFFLYFSLYAYGLGGSLLFWGPCTAGALTCFIPLAKMQRRFESL